MKTALLLKSCVWIFFVLPTICWAQKTYDQLSAREKKLYNEHIVEGQPDGNVPVFVRQGYVVRYNTKFRIPDWSAYHVTPDYLKTPKREGRFKAFRPDPDLKKGTAVVTEDYTGSGYARGHMTPYFAMGGDRDGDNVYASGLADDDSYDANTALEANYMTNIAPQHQAALNGPGGPWYALETAIRTKLVRKNKMELNVITGSIIRDPEDYYVMENTKGLTDIAVPDDFYQIIVYWDKKAKKYITAAFLFKHNEDPKNPEHEDLMDYIVKVDDIEALTKLDFLNKLSPTVQKETESQTNREYWAALIDP